MPLKVDDRGLIARDGYDVCGGSVLLSFITVLGMSEYTMEVIHISLSAPTHSKKYSTLQRFRKRADTDTDTDKGMDFVSQINMYVSLEGACTHHECSIREA